ncbi:MAG: hypothetical protein JST92_15200 [Deltaproteobacteria bacterium]|nr:hypothetical protein [Deltaproteobacteria bacterium]
MSTPPRAHEALAQLQRLLMSVNGVEAEPVGDFLVDEAGRDALAPGASPDEALLVSQPVVNTAQSRSHTILEGARSQTLSDKSQTLSDRSHTISEPAAEVSLGELRVGLFLSNEVLAHLAAAPDSPWTHARLHGFCQATEGVSHFLYLSHRADRDAPVSMLELEAQAEVDKYACVVLQLWAKGRRADSPALRRRLFEKVSLRKGLSTLERERYALANAVAAAAAKVLEARYVLQGRLDAFLRELRSLYRLSGGEKLSALAHGRV